MVHPTVPITFHLEVEVAERLEAFEEHCRRKGEKRTRKSILTEALSGWLARHGFPPKEE